MAAEARHLEVLRPPWRRGHLHPGSTGRDCGVVHEFFAWLLCGRPGTGGHPRFDSDLRLWSTRTSWRELHPDDGSVRGRNERHGGRYPGHDMVGVAAAADLAAHPVY